MKGPDCNPLAQVTYASMNLWSLARSLLNLRVLPTWGHASTEAKMNPKGSKSHVPRLQPECSRHLKGGGRAPLVYGQLRLAGSKMALRLYLSALMV